MAFDHDGFFAIVGKYVKLVNQVDGYIDAIESRKIEIRDIYDTEAILDTYITVPPLIIGTQQNITSWIQTFINDLDNLLLSRPYVIEQLAVPNADRTSILNALYDYMISNSETIESSVVSLGGSDVNENASTFFIPTGGGGEFDSNSRMGPRLYATRILDGINSPGNGVSAHLRYAGIEGQLARTCTMYAEISNSVAGSEIFDLYSDAQETPGYVLEDEEPGVGPSLTSASGQNLISANTSFKIYSPANTPAGWAMAGGAAGTAYSDQSGSGTGPLRIVTAGVTGIQKLSGLQRQTMYFAAINFWGSGQIGEACVMGIKIRNFSDNVTYMTQRTATYTAGTNDRVQAFGFFYLNDNADIDDVYVEFELVSETGIDFDYALLDKIAVAPAVYWNGLGLAAWAPTATFASIGTPGLIYNLIPVGARVSLAVANNDNGVFQSFARKGWLVQLPTADVPTIDDALAT